MTRFLLVTQHFPPEIGAAQTRLMAIAEELGNRGHSVFVITALPNHPRGRVFKGYRRKLLTRERQRGIPVLRTWVLATGTSLPSRLLTYLTFAFSSATAGLFTPRPDVVFVETPPVFAGLSGWLISRFARVPLVLYVADLWTESAAALGVVRSPFLLGLARRVERFVMLRADVICVPTEGVRATIIDNGVARGDVLLLPNGVDVELFQPATPDPVWVSRTRSQAPVFAYIGNHGYVHGLDVVIEAAKIAAHEVEVLLVGEGTEKQRLMLLAQRKGCTNVTFLDAQLLRDVPGILSTCRAALASVRDEPILRVVRSAKMFPALACGKPVIYSGADEGSKIVQSVECGLVVPPGNALLLAEAMIKLARDPQLASQMGARGRAFVIANFTWRRLVGEWLSQLDARLHREA